MKSEKIVCAGFGGQGVLSMGRLLAYAGMIEDKQVSWLPSYGPEMRGGTANCHVIVSDGLIGSPIIAQDATAVIVMNLPSMLKFESELVPGGCLFLNSTLIDRKPSRADIEIHAIPANDIAGELGNGKIANMVMLGAYLERTRSVAIESVLAALRKVFGPSKEHLMPLNEQALREGMRIVSGRTALT